MKSKTSGCGKKTRTELKHAKEVFVLRRDMSRDHAAFLGALDRAIEFHRTNMNDPHNVSAAVVAAVTEIRDAFKTYICYPRFPVDGSGPW